MIIFPCINDGEIKFFLKRQVFWEFSYIRVWANDKGFMEAQKNASKHTSTLFFF